MTRKIICPYHKVNGEPEKTPSLAIYEDGFYCFGCGVSGPLEHLDTNIRPAPKVVENLDETLNRIADLPVMNIRGLDLPTDGKYAYIVWPDRNFYLRRRLVDEPKKPKYLTPGGHKRPPFFLNKGSSTLIVVEGELNALSLAKAFPNTSIVSPGGAGNFKKKDLEKCLQGVNKVIIIADNDEAGSLAALRLKEALLEDLILIKQSLWTEDANALLQERGLDGFREEAKLRLGKV